MIYRFADWWSFLRPGHKLALGLIPVVLLIGGFGIVRTRETPASPLVVVVLDRSNSTGELRSTFLAEMHSQVVDGSLSDGGDLRVLAARSDQSIPSEVERQRFPSPPDLFGSLFNGLRAYRGDRGDAERDAMESACRMVLRSPTSTTLEGQISSEANMSEASVEEWCPSQRRDADSPRPPCGGGGPCACRDSPTCERRGTDLLGALSEAADELHAEHGTDPSDRILVVFSDMLHDLPGERFAQHRLNLDQFFRTLVEDDRIPDLEGVTVYTSGALSDANGIEPGRSRDIRRFWLRYFARAHADVPDGLSAVLRLDT